MWHHTSLNFVHTMKHVLTTTDSKVIAAVMAEPLFFSTAHVDVEIIITVCAGFAKGIFFLLSLDSQQALLPSTGFLWEHRTLVRWRTWRRRRRLRRWLRQATLLPAGVQEGGGREAHRAPKLLPQLLGCWWDGVHFFVSFASMDLQSIFGFEDIFALFTLETTTFNYLFDSFFCRNVFISRRIFQFLLQKLGSSSSISPQGWRSLFLLVLALGGQGLTLAPCFKGEGEGGADGEGEIEGQALAS